MTVTRFDARSKLSQNKSPEVVETVIDELAPINPALAAEMQQVRADR